MFKKNELRLFTVFVMLLYTIVHFICWLRYSGYILIQGMNLNHHSFLCLIVALLFMLVSFFVTWCILTPKNTIKNKKIKQFKNGIELYPFLCICFFLAVFMCITFLFAFSFALHDKHLRLNNHNKNNILHSHKEPSVAIYKNIVMLNGQVKKQKKSFTDRLITFNSCDQNQKDAPYSDYCPQQELLNDNFGEDNSENIEHLVDFLQNHKSYEHIKIIIIGENFKNKRVVLDALQKKTERYNNIQWTLNQPQENVEFYNIGNNQVGTSIEYIPTIHDLNSMNIACEPDLLDYIYFSVYTITTTGYGDIIPVSGYAKFLVTLENIFELFFIVIFFNALLSLNSSRVQSPENRYQSEKC